MARGRVSGWLVAAAAIVVLALALPVRADAAPGPALPVPVTSIDDAAPAQLAGEGADPSVPPGSDAVLLLLVAGSLGGMSLLARSPDPLALRR
jgi:hypothetical protein